MDIEFAGTTAFEVIRGVRRNDGLRLEPAGKVDLSRFAASRGATGDVNFLAAGLAAVPSRSRPATIRVPDANHRKRAQDVHCLTFPKGLPESSLLQLKVVAREEEGEDAADAADDAADGAGKGRGRKRPPTCDVFDGRTVFVDSVPLACVTVAARYQRLVREGKMSEGDAVVRLVELLMEFAGCYGRDPADPLGGNIVDNLPAVTSLAEVQAFVHDAQGVPGKGLLSKALRFARDGSRSAMETCLWIVLTMPASYGLLEFPSARLNMPVMVSEAQRALMRHRTLTPDIQWCEMGVAVEYQGLEGHSGKAALAEDNRRLNDYQVCGIRAFFVTFEDVRSVSKVDKLALDIAGAMRDHGFPNELRRIRRLLADDGAGRLRARHLAHLLPPVRRDDG